MRFHSLISQLKVLACALAFPAVFLVVSCHAGNVTPQAGIPESEATPVIDGTPFAELPAPTELRTTSATNTRYLKQDAVILEGGNITEDSMVLNYGATDLSYQIFSLGPFTEDAPPRVAVISPEYDPYLTITGCPDVYFGIADYTKNTWRWHVAENRDYFLADELANGDYINPETGQALLAVAYYGFGAVDLNHTEGALLGSTGSVYTGDISLENNEDTAVLDGVGVIYGSLYCQHEFSDYESLAGLEAVVGSLNISIPNLSNMELPLSLKHISGLLSFNTSDHVVSIKADGLEYAYSLDVHNATALQELHLHGLRELGSLHNGSWYSLYLNNTPSLAYVFAPWLEKTDSSIIIYQSSEFDAPGFTGELNLSSLQECRSFMISGIESIDTLQLPYVTELEVLELNCRTLESVSFDSLASVSQLRIRNYQGASLPQFPQLTGFGEFGSLTVTDCPALTSLSGLGGLSYEGQLGYLKIEACPMLNSLAGLEWMDGYLLSMTLKNNQLLSDVSALSGVTAIGESPSASALRTPSQGSPGDPAYPIYNLVISGLPALTSLAALNLASVSGSITIASNDNLNSLSGFFTGSEVGGLMINQNPALHSLAGLESLESVGALGVNSNPNLASLAGLDNVTACHTISIGGNPSLSNLDNLTNITHASLSAPHLYYISITGNGGLQSISGLNNLQVGNYGYVVGGYVRVEDNPSLIGGDQAAWDLIDAWGGESVVGGEISISGNGT